MEFETRRNTKNWVGVIKRTWNARKRRLGGFPNAPALKKTIQKQEEVKRDGGELPSRRTRDCSAKRRGYPPLAKHWFIYCLLPLVGLPLWAFCGWGKLCAEQLTKREVVVSYGH
jgi:hypothetical protein